MNFKTILVAALVLGCTVLPVAAVFLYENYRTRDLTADIIARAPERGNFSPQKLTVPAGKEVKLRILNNDTVVHGFAIPALGIDAGEIKAGHVVFLTFTPNRPGAFDFYCTRWCSEFHLQMRGVLEVSGP
ncbi:MAG: cupredoxin domain-containing protein [Planctomycetes bacterium]|nr:cupredoxin domain-containing protein [Planctomycetota bacterium]